MKTPKKLLNIALVAGIAFGLGGCVSKKVVDEGEATCIEITKRNLLSSITTLKFCNAQNYKDQSVYYTDGYLGRIPNRMYAQDGGDFGKLDGLVDYFSINNKEDELILERKKDYKQHKKKFDEADALLKKTKEEFKEYIK